MTQIVIDDAVAAHLASSAASRGCSSADLASALLAQALLGDAELMIKPAWMDRPFTPSAKARVDEGIEASLRGDVVHHEEIEAFFDDWERELQA